METPFPDRHLITGTTFRKQGDIAMESIRELLIEELRDLYDAEKQLVKALPKVAKTANSPELKEAVESHLEETKGHVQRLEQAFELLGQKARGKSCAAMQGLIEEAKEVMQEDMEPALLDSGMICAAQKVEHYEIAGYGTVAAWAQSLGLEDVAELLNETLEEEKAADQKLTEIAGEILSEAASMGEEEEEESVAVATASGRGAVQKKRKTR